MSGQRSNLKFTPSLPPPSLARRSLDVGGEGGGIAASPSGRHPAASETASKLRVQ
jgi:hypothetical protein